MWSSESRDSYLAVMAHWPIARDERSGALSLKIGLIAFRYMPQEHTGKEIGKAFLGILDNMGITVDLKVSSFQSYAFMAY